VPDASERTEPALPKLEPGSLFAGYRIESLLDRGGMGIVYKAVDVDLDRTVALKIIAPEHTQDATAVARFKAEARLAASLEHPNIVPVHRGGEEDGILYLAMRFVPGTNLRRIIDRGPMDLRRIGRIVTDVADALDTAHARGLVHRDVKPANILVAGEPEHEHVYLSDFGLTKRLGSVGALTRTGSWVGTPDYVAPEQIRGLAVDGRADIYSLGCVVYEMLTGHVAYPKDSDMAKLWAHVTDPPPLPSTARPDLVEAFDEVVARATAKDPNDRYATAGELAAAVRDAIGQQEAEQRRAVQPTEAEDAPGPPSGAHVSHAAPTPQAAGVPVGVAHDPGTGGAEHEGGPRAGWLRRHRGPAIVLLVLLACAIPVAVILLSNSESSTPDHGQRATENAGQRVTAELAQVPTNHVNGVGNALLQLNGTVATVSVNTSGLLNAVHAMHVHAGELGKCPPASAAHRHGGHLSISTLDGVPWYGPPVTALTTRGDTSAKSILAFRRFLSGGVIRYTRRFDVGKAVAATIRHDNAVVVVHGIDYNRNGIYDYSALDRSDLKRSLPGETTAPALCGALVAAPQSQSGPTKTGQVPGAVRTYTASLNVEPATPAWLCILRGTVGG
jgi:hypothetical protein